MRSRASGHRSKQAAGFVLPLPLAFAGACAALGACRKDPTVVVRTVTVNVPAACAGDGGAYATDYEYGDFEPEKPAEGHYLAEAGVPLPEVDPQARALVVQMTEGTSSWAGVTDVPATGDVDVLALPQVASCALSGKVTENGPRTGAALGAIAPGSVMLVGGSEPAESGPQTFVADLATGVVHTIYPDLLSPRSHATLTPFGDGALVAGGLANGVVLQTAEVYDASAGGFQQQSALMMSAARTQHGAVVLATGETLLVGGIGADRTTVLGTMEIIDPATRVIRADGVPQLAFPRRDPSVLLLASGEVLVAGGVDGSGAPVSQLEWFSPDVTQEVATYDLGAIGSAQAYVALEAGGALAVAGEDAGACSFSVWQISAAHKLQSALPFMCSAPPAPVFFGGAQGAPVLWTGGEWLRWQPWEGTFDGLTVLEDVTKDHVGDATCAPDPGMAMWLDPSTMQLTVLRFDTTNAYSTLDELLVMNPSSMAPDVFPFPGVVSFDTQSLPESLELGPTASAFVTDRTYADVAVDVLMTTSPAPYVVLRDGFGDEVEVGGVSCPANLSSASGAPLHVERHGATVTWSTTQGISGTCAGTFAADARLSLGLRGNPDATTTSGATDLQVRRLSP